MPADLDQFTTATFTGPGRAPSGPQAGDQPRSSSGAPAEAAATAAATALPAADPAPDRVLPADVAMLLVTRSGDEHFTLQGFGSSGALEQIGPFKCPDVALSRIGSNTGLTPVQILNRMFAWSRGLKELITWIEAGRARLGSELKLVIADKAGFEIPWELMSLPIADDEYEYLGAEVAVTRCQLGTFVDPEARASVYSEDEVTCAGGVVAYLCKELTAIAHDEAALQKLGAQLAWDTEEFLKSLDAEAGECALVYVACHGIPGAGLDSALGWRDDDDQRIVLGTLDRTRLRLVRRSGSAIVLNACESGRFFEAEEIADDLLYGFPSLFLGKGARGVIATAGEVPDKAAGEMAQQLLLGAQEDGVLVAALLRRLRKAAADAYAARTATEADLLTPFVYLYFGSPRCALRVG